MKELPSRGLDPRVHVFIGMHASKTWVAGTSPATGQEKAFDLSGYCSRLYPSVTGPLLVQLISSEIPALVVDAPNAKAAR